MNRLHHWYCRSARWKSAVENAVVPWTLDDVDLGADVLELGPGPGAATSLLRTRAKHLTCVEMDRGLADTLTRRMSGTNVTVLCEDASALPIEDATFDGVVSFTMLHHVPSVALQDRVLAEVARVLRPNGIFAGTDSLVSPLFRLLHLFDTMVPVDPTTFAERLGAAHFTDIHVEVSGDSQRFRFHARRSAAQ